MKHVLTIASIFICMTALSQTNFEKGMQRAFTAWGADNLSEAELLFERIASAEPDEWLPNYYIAQINSLKTWNEKDATIVKAQLDKAQDYLNSAMAISKNNPEIMVLQAHILTNWVAFDGMTYGMKYSAKISELYQNAESIAPSNPRVVLGLAEWQMGSATYFGKDTTPYCKDIERAIELFANFKPESPLHPRWGRERTMQVLTSCKKL